MEKLAPPPSPWIAALNSPQCLAVSQFQCIYQQESGSWERSIFCLSASLQRSSEQRRNRDKVGLQRSRPWRIVSGQGRVWNPRFRPAAARHFVAAPSLIYWLIVKKQGFCGIDAVACVSTWKLAPERCQWVEACWQPEGKAMRLPAKDASMRRSWHNGKHFSTSVVRFIIAISRRPTRHQYYNAGLLDGTGDVVGIFSCCEYSRQRDCRQAAFRGRDGSVFVSSLFPVWFSFFPTTSELPLH